MTVKIKRNDIQQAEQVGSIVEQLVNREDNIDDIDISFGQTGLSVWDKLPSRSRNLGDISKFKNITLWFRNNFDATITVNRVHGEMEEGTGVNDEGPGEIIVINEDVPVGARYYANFNDWFSHDNTIKGFLYWGVRLDNLDEVTEGNIKWVVTGSVR